MANVKFTRPQHIARLFHSYWDGAAWSAHVEITDTFLNDPTKSHVGTASGQASLTDDLTEKDRFIIYYGSYINSVWTAASGTIDSIAMASLSQVSGLTLKTYGDDSIALGSVPTTLLDTHVQSADTFPLDTKDEFIQFTEATKQCFMVERTGIDGQNSGTGNINFVKNSGFDDVISGSDLEEWSEVKSGGFVSTGASRVLISLPTSDAGVEHSYITQQLGITTTAETTFRINAVFDGITAGSGVDVAEIRLATTSGGDDIDSYQITTSNNQSSLEYTVVVSAAVNVDYLTMGIFEANTGDVGNLVMYCQSLQVQSIDADVYTGSPLDTGAIIFGGDAFTPTQNFNNSPEQDDSNKYEQGNSGSRSFLTLTNSNRRESLDFGGITNTDKNTLEHLDKTLVNGLCIYQRDGSSVDTEDWFIGRYSVTPSTAINTTENNIKVTVSELVARG